MSLDRDPRWLRLHDHTWTCPCCGLKHGGLFDLAWAKPDVWLGGAATDQDSEVLDPNNVLTEDVCIVNGEHFFIRCVLLLPIVAHPEASFGFGVWSSLSKANFARYLDTFDTGEQSHLGPWFGWLSNRLPGYPDTTKLKCHVHPRDGRDRPAIELEPTEHPLAIEQREGITFDRILEIYAASGHDLRAALSD